MNLINVPVGMPEGLVLFPLCCERGCTATLFDGFLCQLQTRPPQYMLRGFNECITGRVCT